MPHALSDWLAAATQLSALRCPRCQALNQRSGLALLLTLRAPALRLGRRASRSGDASLRPIDREQLRQQSRDLLQLRPRVMSALSIGSLPMIAIAWGWAAVAGAVVPIRR